MSMRSAGAALAVTLLLGAGLARAGTPASPPPPSTDAAIDQLRQDVRAKRSDLIAKAMEFTASEAAAFWPLYQKYEQTQKGVGDEKVALIKDFAAHYDTLTDAKSSELVTRLKAIEDKALASKRSFVESLQGVLPAKKVARYYQVETRLQLLTDLTLASQIPLIR